MYDAYSRIFTRMGLKFRAVQADGGSIGGDTSQEFHVLADSGEDAIAFSDSDGYAANLETAASLAPATPRAAAAQPIAKVATPNARTIAEVCALLGVAPAQCVKTLLVEGAEGGVVALVIRGDHELNAVKSQKLDGVASPLKMAGADRIRAAAGAEPGFIGPVGFTGRIYVDHAAAQLADFVCGANEKDMHYRGVNWGRDLPDQPSVDIRNVQAGDPSPTGRGTLRNRPRHRGRAHIPAGAALQRRHECHGARRTGQGLDDVHGLLRHRRDPGGGRRDRTEPRCQRHFLARGDRAISGGAGTHQLSEIGPRFKKLPTRCTAISTPPASTCCWTTAMRGPASNSPMPSSWGYPTAS